MSHLKSQVRILRRSARQLILFLSVLFFFTQAGTGGLRAQAEKLPADNPTVRDIDRIHQGDVVEVDVVGSFEFDWRGGLNPEGFLDGFERAPQPIFARCKTPEALSREVTEVYSKILKDPVIEVRILDRNGRALTYVDGAVKTPTRFRIKRDVHLNELIVLAGGFTDVIGDDISVFRPAGLSCEGAGSAVPAADGTVKSIKLSDMLAGEEGTNPKIVAGDIVSVTESLPIFVIGGVGDPRRLSARSGVTVSRAIDAAGGLSKSGQAREILVYRRAGTTARAIPIDLEKIRAGAAEDLKLEANDIVEVPLKGEPKRKFPPVVYETGSKNEQLPLRVID